MPHSQPNWQEFVQGWQLDIYRDPIYCGLIAGLLLGYLGVFIVLRRMVFVTAAVSQAAGLGVALAFFVDMQFGLALPPVAGAIVMALVCTAVFALPIDRLPISRESVLGVIYLVAWAASVMVGDRIAQEAHDIAAILFGTAVLVQPADMWALCVVAALALLVHLWWQRGIVFAIFDAEGARVQGLPVRAVELTSWLLTALAVSVATRALGVLPVFAFAVLPAASGLMLARRLRWVLVWAAFSGAIAGGGGYLIAFFYEFPVGASQAACGAVLWLASLPIWALMRRRA
jgi:zinc transport system permease protein